MAGEHLAELEKWKSGMFPIDVEVSRDAWHTGATSIEAVRTTLKTAALQVTQGFGPGAEISTMASDAFTAAADRLEVQHNRMKSASKALTEVDTAMNAALGVASPTDPGPAPTLPSTPGSLPNVSEIREHAVAVAHHNAQVEAYTAADNDAKAKIEKLQTTYADAISVFTEIHGDPYVPSDPDGSSSSTSGPGPSAPTSPVSPVSTSPSHPTTGGPHPIHHPPHVDTGIPVEPGHPGVHVPGDPGLPPHVVPPHEGGDIPPGPHVGGTGGSGGEGGGGGGIHPAVIGGGIAAGAFGAPAIAKGVRGLLGKQLGSVSGASIGGTTRAGGPGALGRPGAAAGGTARAGAGAGAGAGRGGGAAAAAGRPAGRGGGRGSAGGRGGAAAAGARGGRKDDDQQGPDQDFFDDGEGWLDDDGAAPGVLG